MVLGKTPGLTREALVRAGAVIRTFGRPGKFYRSTNIYLTIGDVKYWTMDARVRDTTLVNRATTDRTYGPQDAPDTSTGTFTGYDAIAADFDLRRDSSKDAHVRDRIASYFGDRSPRTLDVGCGSGALLDLGVVSPRQYTGVDCSQGMLNELVLKHPSVCRVVPARFEELSDADLGSPFDLVVAMDVPGVDVGRLRSLCRGLFIVTGGNR